MNDKLRALRELAIPFPIPASFRRQARAYASQYFTSVAQERVYLNTLAILVADAYLRLLGFETNLSNPERWNVVERLWSEANELELPGLGNLECCLINTEQENITVPSENLSDTKNICIGYLFVEIASSQTAATLIGFLPAVHSEIIDAEVAIADVQSMDDLVDYLAQLQTTQTNDLTQEFAEQKITYLRNWLNNSYTADWEPSMRDLRGATCKKKLHLAEQVFELQLSVSQIDDELLSVIVIVQGKKTYLPRGMQVSVPDDSDIYTETVNEAADLISIPLELAYGEEFWVELRIEDAYIREYFIV